MAQKRIILAFVLLLLVVAGLIVWQKRPVAAPIRLDLTGTAGLKVAGTVIVDGDARKFSGELPASINVAAREFEYTILMQEPQGELNGQLTVANGVYGSSSTAEDYTGVRGFYAHRWTSKGGGFTTARKEDLEAP